MKISPEVQAERDRCEEIARNLAAKWRASAEECRTEGTYKPYFGKPYVVASAERDAKTLDAAAHGCEAIAELIRVGATKKKGQPGV